MNLTLLTPTYAGDYERFCLQRESIRRCGITIPQVAVVHKKDLPLFSTISDRENLTILTLDDVLPREIVRRLDAWRLRRRNPRRWFSGPPMGGWHCQQFVKLAAGGFINTPGIICMDSDTVFLRHADAADFVSPDGRLHLYETTEIDAEIAEWLGIAMRFLGVSPQKLPVTNFTHAPTLMHRDVLLEMIALIERRHHQPWYRVFDPLEARTMEYSLYGVFAKYLGNANRVVSVRPQVSACYWWTQEVQEIQSTFAARTAPPEIKMVHIQSNAGVPVSAYRDLLEHAWV